MAIVLNPSTGLRDVTQFPSKPTSGAAAREQIQGIIDQVVNQSNSELAGKANISQPAWIAPTLLNSWVNFATTYNYATGYFVDNFGFVHIEGRLSGGTSGTVAFTLPVGYRPTKDFLVVIATNTNAFGTAFIKATGDVVLYFASGTWCDLGQIIFRP